MNSIRCQSTPCLKNVPPLACHNFDTHKWILTSFGRNVTDKVGNQKTLHYATSSNLCFCTTWQNGKTRKSHFSLNLTVLHAQCTCALSSWKKKNVIYDVFDSQLSLLPQWDWDGKWVPAKVRWCSAAESTGRYDSFHFWMYMWVAGKSMWSLANTRRTFRSLKPWFHVKIKLF